jgi:hypothetical protein
MSTSSYKGFKGLQKEIASLSTSLLKIGFSSSYFSTKFNIDAEFYKDWLSGDVADFAELTVLYLPPETRTAIVTDVRDLSALNG